MKYGLTDTEWNSVKREIRLVLQEAAKNRGLITYSDLVSRLRTVQLGHRDPAVGALLGEISVEEDAAGRGMLSAIVVHKQGDMEPGPGFFELAASLGRDTSDALTCWAEEFKKVHKYWSVEH